MGDYHHLDKQNKTLLLCDKFENFREMCIETFDDDLIHICTVPGLTWFAALEKIKIKLKLKAEIDLLLMIEKKIKVRVCHTICWTCKSKQ